MTRTHTPDDVFNLVVASHQWSEDGHGPTCAGFLHDGRAFYFRLPRRSRPTRSSLLLGYASDAFTEAVESFLQTPLLPSSV